MPESSQLSGVQPGIIVDILEPFKKLTIQNEVEKNGKTLIQKVTAGVIYQSDTNIVWDNNIQTPEQYEEAARWSPSRLLPNYAVRHRATVVKSEHIPLQLFTKEQIKLLRLDYESQEDPQLIINDYIPHKDFELLYLWWKQHYKNTLRKNNNPVAVVLHLAKAE